MKRILSTILYTLILCFLLGSCASTSFWLENQQITSELTYQTACDLYSQAQEIYAWYTHGWIAVDDAQTITDNNNTYYLCVDAKLPDNCNMDGLREFLETFFSRDFVAALLQKVPCQFVEKDGILYAGCFGGGSDLFVGKEHLSEEIEKLSDTEYSLTVYADILNQDLEPTGEQEEFHFYLIAENGKWVFRDFQLVR